MKLHGEGGPKQGRLSFVTEANRIGKANNRIHAHTLIPTPERDSSTKTSMTHPAEELVNEQVPPITTTQSSDDHVCQNFYIKDTDYTGDSPRKHS